MESRERISAVHFGSTHSARDRNKVPYSRLFLWGANFRYFRGFTRVSRNFPPTKIFHTLCCAVYTCSNLDRRRFVMVLFCNLHRRSALGPPSPPSQAVPRSTTKRKRSQYLLYNAEEHKVTLTANGSAPLSFSRWHSRCSSVLASKMSL